MAQLLLDEHPLVILPSLAVKLGLNEAIILQQLHYWLQKSNHEHQGKRWVYNSYPEWQKQFPWWSTDTIKRTITKLEKKGVITSGNFNKSKLDKTKWYTIDYNRLGYAPTMRAICTDQEGKLHLPIPETTTETNDKHIYEQFTKEFDQWWDKYPNKKGKGEARDRWVSLRKKGVTVEQLNVALDNYLAEIKRRGTDKDYIKYGSTFLGKKKGWEDYINVEQKQSPAALFAPAGGDW